MSLKKEFRIKYLFSIVSALDCVSITYLCCIHSMCMCSTMFNIHCDYRVLLWQFIASSCQWLFTAHNILSWKTFFFCALAYSIQSQSIWKHLCSCLEFQNNVCRWMFRFLFFSIVFAVAKQKVADNDTKINKILTRSKMTRKLSELAVLEISIWD